MNYKKMTNVIIIALIISILINIVLLIGLQKERKKDSFYLVGIYQTQYFNNYDHSMTITLKLYEDGTCKFSHYATEYSDKENDSYWERKNNVLEISNNQNLKEQIDILSSGNLLYDNHELKKIS